MVYIATGVFGKVYAINADTGAILWQSTDPIQYAFGPPTVVNGKMYIADCGPNYDGKGAKLWGYQLVPKTAMNPPPPVSNNFNITIGSSKFNLKYVASTGIIDKNTGGYIQRIYNASYFLYSSYTFYIRFPIAGVPPTSALPYGFDWQYTDAWLIQGKGPSAMMLGKYDPKSWQMIGDGSIQMTLTEQTICEGNLNFHMIIELKCATGPMMSTITQMQQCTCKYYYTYHNFSFLITFES